MTTFDERIRQIEIRAGLRPDNQGKTIAMPSEDDIPWLLAELKAARAFMNTGFILHLDNERTFLEAFDRSRAKEGR